MAAAFRLRNPERLVIDMQGAAPKRSHLMKSAEIPQVSALRIGKSKSGTRLVLDLQRLAQEEELLRVLALPRHEARHLLGLE